LVNLHRQLRCDGLRAPIARGIKGAIALCITLDVSGGALQFPSSVTAVGGALAHRKINLQKNYAENQIQHPF